MHGDKLPEDHQPAVKQVFELGGKGLLRMARDLAEDPEVPAAPDFFIGAVATVFNPKSDWQPRSLLAKADAAEDAVIRLVVEDEKFGFTFDTEQPGDTTFAHAERTVLVIDAQISESLADHRLDLHVEDDRPHLKIVKQLPE